MFWQLITGELKAQMFEERLRHYNIPVIHPNTRARHSNSTYFEFKNKDRINVEFIVFELEDIFRRDTIDRPTKKRKLCLD